MNRDRPLFMIFHLRAFRTLLLRECSEHLKHSMSAVSSVFVECSVLLTTQFIGCKNMGDGQGALPKRKQTELR